MIVKSLSRQEKRRGLQDLRQVGYWGSGITGDEVFGVQSLEFSCLGEGES